MLMTIDSGHFLVTAYPGGQGVRALVSITDAGGTAAGGAEMIGEMARELEAAGRLLSAAEAALLQERRTEDSPEKAGGKKGEM